METSTEMPPQHPFQEAEKQEKAPKASRKGANPFTGNLKKQRLRRLVITGMAVFLVLSGLGYYLYSTGRSEILIRDTSTNLTITLNNQPVRATLSDKGYTIPSFAGTYRLQITKPNYVPFVQDIQLGRGQTLEVRPAYAFQPTSRQSEVATVDYVRPSADQKSVFYLGDNRKTIYRMEVSNQVRIPLTNTALKGVSDVQWSSQPDVALITQNDGVYLREIPTFDYRTQTLVKLGGAEIISPIWDPLNPERLAFAYYPASGEKSLVFTNKHLSPLDRKADLSGLTNPRLIWSADDTYIAVLNRSADTSQNNLWIYTTADGSFKLVTTSGNVMDASFSPESDIILYETAANNGASKLSSIKPDGSANKDLNITGKVLRAAWHDNGSFFLPNDNDNSLTLYGTDGSTQKAVFAFPTALKIKGMNYFKASKSLIFYTDDSIYTVELAL